jgi:hypothetical protein
VPPILASFLSLSSFFFSDASPPVSSLQKLLGHGVSVGTLQDYYYGVICTSSHAALRGEANRRYRAAERVKEAAEKAERRKKAAEEAQKRKDEAVAAGAGAASDDQQQQQGGAEAGVEAGAEAGTGARTEEGTGGMAICADEDAPGAVASESKDGEV